MKEVNSFNKNINNINLSTRFYEEGLKKLKMKYNKYKNLHKILDTIGSLIFIGSTSRSISFSITGFDLIVLTITAGVTCGVAISSKLTSENFKKKRNIVQKNVLEQITQFNVFEKCIKKV